MNHILQYQINASDGTFGRTLANAKNKTAELDNMIKRVGGILAAAYSADRLFDYGKEAVMTSGKLQAMTNVIKFGSKDMDDYAENTRFLNKIITDLNLPIEATTMGFSSLMGAMKGTENQGKVARDIFQGINEAGASLHLTSDQFGQITLAIQQMQSKGKVMAQELTLQLGNAIPGAQKLAADSMGVTTKKLMDMMEKGQVLANDFLPKFGKHLHEVFGEQAKTAAESFQAQMQKNETAIWRIAAAVGEKLQPAYLNMQQMQVKAAETGASLVNFYFAHEKAIKSVAVGVGILVTAYTALSAVKKINAFWDGITILDNIAVSRSMFMASIGAAGLENAFIALNISMAANPAAWIVGGIAALAAGIYFLGKKTEEAEKKSDKLSDTMRRSNAEMNVELTLLKDTSNNHATKIRLINDLNSKYGEYLPNLITEKTTVKELSEYQKLANDEFDRKIKLQAMDESMTPLLKNMVATQVAIMKTEEMLDNLKTNEKYNNFIGASDPLENNLIMLRNTYGAQQKSYQKAQGLWNKLGGVNSNIKAAKPGTDTANLEVAAHKSIRNVNVRIDALVKELKVYLNGGMSDTSGVANLKKELTKLLVSVVRDSEIALG